MSRSLLSRSLEPLVAISWAVFIIWSVWLTVVWVAGIDRASLGLPVAGHPGDSGGIVVIEEKPQPPYLALRQAVFIFAQNAELAWLALALVQLHLSVVRLNGVNTARTWMAIALGGAFLLGASTRAFGIPFGWMFFTPVLGARFLGVPLGWLLLWAVLIVAARETILRFRPRLGHLALTTATAALVVLTMMNLTPIASHLRLWWIWHAGDVRTPANAPAWFILAWFPAAWLLAFLMRERTVTAAAARRSIRPVGVLIAINAAALLTHLIQ